MAVQVHGMLWIRNQNSALSKAYTTTYGAAEGAAGDDEIDSRIPLKLVDATLGYEALRSLVAAEDLKENGCLRWGVRVIVDEEAAVLVRVGSFVTRQMMRHGTY